MNRTQRILDLAQKHNQDVIPISKQIENKSETTKATSCDGCEDISNIDGGDHNLENLIDIENTPIIILEQNGMKNMIIDKETNNFEVRQLLLLNEAVGEQIEEAVGEQKQKKVAGEQEETVGKQDEAVGVEEKAVEEQEEVSEEELIVEDLEQGLTKKGTERKRKRYKSSLSTRKQQKIERQALVHNVHPPCNEKCRKKCTNFFTEEERIVINRAFWNLNYIARRVFIENNTLRKSIKRRRGAEDSTRQNTFEYYLKNGSIMVPVCKTFFLTTLGFSKNNNTVVHDVLTQPNHSPKPDGRGRHEKPKTDREIIRTHIESFHPCVSHYRREHAPNKRYLPSDVTISSMHKDFISKHPNLKCSYDLYRSIVAQMNISFTKLGHEQCESCEFFSLHNPDHSKENLATDCDDCNSWDTHIKKANEAREKYREDRDCKNREEGDVVFSADLEKVIMLPRMDTFKAVVFTPRIIAFNESFVPVGNNQNLKPLAVLWHEAVRGRKKEDIISAFYHFFLSNRDATKITLWLDNCSAQNKSWALYTCLVYMINSKEISAKEIVINYFEPGHTFMSCDSFHHQVELSMKHAGKVYDFNDFVNCVQAANSGKVYVKSMSPTDFYKWQDYASLYKLKNTVPRPYMASIVQIVAKRGDFQLLYKNQFSEELKPLNFLMAKILKTKTIEKPEAHTLYRGIPQQKKDSILTNLIKLMPVNRHDFWNSLPVDMDVPDLITTVE